MDTEKLIFLDMVIRNVNNTNAMIVTKITPIEYIFDPIPLFENVILKPGLYTWNKQVMNLDEKCFYEASSFYKDINGNTIFYYPL
jgi:hypothetical protein